MARSKDVYTVLGKLCIDEEYRSAFFDQPVTKARELVGSLTTDEIDQIKDLAGYTKPPEQRTAFRVMASAALHGVYAAYNCPVRPCPDPDDADPTSAA